MTSSYTPSPASSTASDDSFFENRFHFQDTPHYKLRSRSATTPSNTPARRFAGVFIPQSTSLRHQISKPISNKTAFKKTFTNARSIPRIPVETLSRMDIDSDESLPPLPEEELLAIVKEETLVPVKEEIPVKEEEPLAPVKEEVIAPEEEELILPAHQITKYTMLFEDWANAKIVYDKIRNSFLMQDWSSMIQHGYKFSDIQHPVFNYSEMKTIHELEVTLSPDRRGEWIRAWRFMTKFKMTVMHFGPYTEWDLTSSTNLYTGYQVFMK